MNKFEFLSGFNGKSVLVESFFFFSFPSLQTIFSFLIQAAGEQRSSLPPFSTYIGYIGS